MNDHGHRITADGRADRGLPLPATAAAVWNQWGTPMATLQQLNQGLERTWHHVSEGWNQLRRHASRAITRFQPRHHRDGLQRPGEQIPDHAPAWGLLAAEVRETEDQIVVRLEAPGLEPDGFDLEIVDDVLVIRGEKQVQNHSTQGNYHITECAYGAFERAIPLPGPVDPARTRAKYRRGVLQVSLPKDERTRRRRILVQTP